MKSCKNVFKGIGAFALSGVLLVSCGPDEPIKTDETKTGGEDTVITEKIKEKIIHQVDNAMFSIPSPIQLGSIIQKSGAAYNEDLLNVPTAVNNYTDVVSQSLNLGIYGADLGYTALYEKSQESIKFMRSAQKLSDGLGISEAFDGETLTAVQRNLNSGNKDSLLYVISNSYRKADDFLQSTDRKHIGALVVVGGWIESMHFAGQLGLANKSPEIQNMVGMQKHTLNTMIDKMLERYLNAPGVEDIYNQLEEIRVLFDAVEIKYEFVKPETDKAKKSTTLKSKSSVEISDELFKQIVDKIEAIRSNIIK